MKSSAGSKTVVGIVCTLRNLLGWFLPAVLVLSACLQLPQATTPVLAQPATFTIQPKVATTEPAPMATPVPAITTPQKTVYYVAPTGDDANTGTKEQPWRTIQRAANALVAGETVYIREGTYREQVTPKNSGSVGNEIVYAAYPGETVILDGEGIKLQDDLAGLVDIRGQNYIRISGLRVINAGTFRDNAGIMAIGSSYITIIGNSTYNTVSSGIGAWESQHIIIDGNTVELAGTGGYQECITVAISRGFEVMNNTVIDCQKEGITLKDGSFDGSVYRNVVKHPLKVGIYVDASAKATGDIRVFQNIVFDSIQSAGFVIASEVGGYISNIRLENNLAYHNFTYGIEISRCCLSENPTDSHPMNSIVIVNNTVYENGVDWGGGILADNSQAQNVIIRNNIISQNLTFQLAVAADVPPASMTADHNLIDGFRDYTDEIYGTDFIEGDPLFVNPDVADFHLQEASLAVDAGSEADAPLVDFDNAMRPQDGDRDGIILPDIGAFELAL